MKLYCIVAMLVGLLTGSAPRTDLYEGPSVVRVGFDCTNTVAEGDTIRCLDCGRAWGIEPTEVATTR